MCHRSNWHPRRAPLMLKRGCVFLSFPKMGNLYALKCIDKVWCIKSQATTNVMQGQHLLEEVHHPFIVNTYVLVMT